MHTLRMTVGYIVTCLSAAQVLHHVKTGMWQNNGRISISKSALHMARRHAAELGGRQSTGSFPDAPSRSDARLSASMRLFPLADSITFPGWMSKWRQFWDRASRGLLPLSGGANPHWQQGLSPWVTRREARLNWKHSRRDEGPNSTRCVSPTPTQRHTK